MTMRVVLGIDPGQSGAIAVVADGRFDRFIDMPTLPRAAGGLHIDDAQLAAVLRGVLHLHQGAYVFAVLEEVSAMPKQGITSTFRFGESFGVVRGTLGALGIPRIQVRPERWKRHLQLLGKEKDQSRTVAVQLYPEAAGQLLRKKDCGRADALLIASWAESTQQVPKVA